MKKGKKNERKGVMETDGRMSRRFKLLRISPYHSFPRIPRSPFSSFSPLTCQSHLLLLIFIHNNTTNYYLLVATDVYEISNKKLKNVVT